MGHCPGGCSGDVDGSVGLWAEGISFFSSSPPLVSPVRGLAERDWRQQRPAVPKAGCDSLGRVFPVLSRLPLQPVPRLGQGGGGMQRTELTSGGRNRQESSREGQALEPELVFHSSGVEPSAVPPHSQGS